MSTADGVTSASDKPSKIGRTPVIDLHCDLLDYLVARAGRTPRDPASHCSVDQLRAGGVRLQVLALYSMTCEGSTEVGSAQASLFRSMADDLREHLVKVETNADLETLVLDGDGPVGTVAGVENAAVFAEEYEPFGDVEARFQTMAEAVGPIAYVGLTWRGENRFGGGHDTRIGLKQDGKRLLEFLSGRRIAVDLSHASDRLAEEILEEIDRRALGLMVMASHSNLRAVASVQRNLPSEIAKEICLRGGVIGFTLLAPLVGSRGVEDFVRHFEAGQALGLGGSLCLGADFFCSDDLPPYTLEGHEGPIFLEGYEDSSCYPKLESELKRLGLSSEARSGLAWENACGFFERLWTQGQ